MSNWDSKGGTGWNEVEHSNDVNIQEDRCVQAKLRAVQKDVEYKVSTVPVVHIFARGKPVASRTQKAFGPHQKQQDIGGNEHEVGQVE